MQRIIRLASIVTVAIAVLLLLIIGISAVSCSDVTPVSDRVEYYKLHVDLATAVLVGFGAALLGILIPTVFAEARFSFERLRESRKAYSEAKTAVDYLPLRLCSLPLKEAALFVQRAHVKKHHVELYAELAIHLKRRGIGKTPEQWCDELYDRLFTARTMLENHAAQWDSLTPDKRLALIREFLPAPRREDLVEGAVSAAEEKAKAEALSNTDVPEASHSAPCADTDKS